MTDWSQYQKAIFEAVENTTDSLIIEAVAGSGKTTTIVEAIRHVPREQSVVFLAFNKSIAEELKRRVVQPNAKCMTLHSLGLTAWKQHLAWGANDLEIDGKKVRNIVDSLELPYGEWTREMSKLVGLAKGAGIVPQGLDRYTSGAALYDGLIPDDDSTWDELMEFYGVDYEEVDLELVRKVLAMSIEQARAVIDFDDMLYMPIIAGAAFEKTDVVFLDEAQDVNGIQAEIVARMLGPESRVVAVGDPHQCQPAGTLVRVPDGRNVRIETLRDGDKVVSADISHSCFKAGGETIYKVSKRNYLGPLVEVFSEGRKSAYTPNHRCIANPKPLCSKYVVYLMQRGENWRIGSTQFGVMAGSGIRTRLMTEKADALWVLSIHETRAEARFQEAMIATTHGIPERTFISQNSNGKGLNQELLDRFWNCIPHQGAKALNLLALFNRNVEYPLVSKATARKFSVRRPSQIQACNLLPGMLVLHDQPTIHYKKHQWKPIEQVLHYNFDGEVYSLGVTGAHTYIADGITTHNSIYGFRGALQDSMKRLGERFHCVSLPLSVSYRCPSTVVMKAREWVKHIEPSESAPLGLVEDCPEWDVRKFLPGDAVLCRNARPVVTVAFLLIRNKIAAKVVGRDIGQGLVSLVEKMKATNIVDLDARLAKYRTHEALRAKGNEAKIAALDDKLDTIRVFMEEAGPHAGIGTLIKSIEALFGEGQDMRGMVTCSTVHKSKGLEFERVFVLDADLYMPSRWARQPWERQQEDNLCYVAATRAKRELRYISTEGLRSGEQHGRENTASTASSAGRGVEDPAELPGRRGRCDARGSDPRD
jgi:superfamily I DNA/RNA helicase